MNADDRQAPRFRGYNPKFVRTVLARRHRDGQSAQLRQGRPDPGRQPMRRIAGVPSWVSEIINETAAKYRIGAGEMLGRSRQVRVVAARNEMFYRIREKNPQLSFPKIGLWFGRDHTAVMFAIASHARRNGLPELTGFDLDGHNAARARFAEKRRRQRLAERSSGPPADVTGRQSGEEDSE